MNIIIPAAGLGTRFKEAGYNLSKPFIPIKGKPMIDRVINNITPTLPNTKVLITLNSAPIEKDGIIHISLEKPTEGAVATVLKAKDYITNAPLLIANCDQLIAGDINHLIDSELDGVIAVFKSNLPHHSYVKLNEGVITDIAEKQVISNLAVSGVYYFKHGTDFLESALEVVEHDERYNGEYYISSVLSRMINKGYCLGVFETATAILGTPEDFQRFETALEVQKCLGL